GLRKQATGRAIGEPEHLGKELARPQARLEVAGYDHHLELLHSVIVGEGGQSLTPLLGSARDGAAPGVLGNGDLLRLVEDAETKHGEGGQAGGRPRRRILAMLSGA